MKTFIKDMPFYSELGGDKTDCALWQSDENICDLRASEPGVCDPSGLYYGTTDSREPKFCGRHFYHRVVLSDGDGETGYELVDW